MFCSAECVMNAHARSRQNTVSTKELQIGNGFTFQAALLREEHNLLSVWERGVVNAVAAGDCKNSDHTASTGGGFASCIIRITEHVGSNGVFRFYLGSD